MSFGLDAVIFDTDRGGSASLDAFITPPTIYGDFGIDATLLKEQDGFTVDDEYTNVEANTWGRPSRRGRRYTYNANEDQYSKDGVKGTIRNNAATQFVYAQEEDPNKDILLTHDLNDRPNHISAEVDLGVNSSAYVRHRVAQAHSPGDDQIELWVGGSRRVTFGDGVQWGGGWWNTKVRHRGNNYKVKVWREGDPEPGWQIDYEYTSPGSGKGYIRSWGHNWFGSNGHPWYWLFKRWATQNTEVSMDADAVLFAGVGASFSLGAIIGTEFSLYAYIDGGSPSAAFSADAVVHQQAEASLPLDAALERLGEADLQCDAVIAVASDGGLSADAIVRATQDDLVGLDAVIGVPDGDVFTIGAAITAQQQDAFQTEAVVAAERDGTFDVDAVTLRGHQDGLSLAASIAAPGGLSFDLWAVTKGTGSGTLSVDAALLRVLSDSFAVGSVVSRIEVAAFSVGADLKATHTGGFGAGAALLSAKAFSLDAYIAGRGSGRIEASLAAATISAAMSAATIEASCSASTISAAMEAATIEAAFSMGTITWAGISWAARSGSFGVDAVLM